MSEKFISCLVGAVLAAPINIMLFGFEPINAIITAIIVAPIALLILNTIDKNGS